MYTTLSVKKTNRKAFNALAVLLIVLQKTVAGKTGWFLWRTLQISGPAFCEINEPSIFPLIDKCPIKPNEPEKILLPLPPICITEMSQLFLIVQIGTRQRRQLWPNFLKIPHKQIFKLSSIHNNHTSVSKKNFKDRTEKDQINNTANQNKLQFITISHAK